MTTSLRVAALADLHVGLDDAEETRVHDWIASDLERRVAHGERLHAIVLAGDIFHATPRPWEMLRAATLAQRFATLAPLIVVRGNHDPDLSLRLLSHLDSAHRITVLDRPGVVALDTGAVAVIPWLDPIPGVDRKLSAAARAAREREVLDTILRDLADDLAAAAGLGGKVLATHCTIGGAKASAGQPVRGGRDFTLSLDDLERVRAHAVVAGHIHCGQRWMRDGMPIVNVGSSRRTAFGELEEKCYVLVEAGPEGARVTPVATPSTAMVLVNDAWVDRGGSYGFNGAVAEALPAVSGARVRYRYDVGRHAATAARAAAEQVKATLLAAGAAEVKIERRFVVERKARVDLAEDHTLLDLFDAWADREGVEEGLRVRARELLGSLDTEARRGAIPAGGLRLHRLRFAGIGPFTEEVDLDLDALPGEIVAIRGENGEGKSLLCSLFPAALHRQSERGALKDEELGSEAFLDATVSIDGEPWVLEHRPAEGKAWARRPDGTVVDETGKVSAFDRFAAEHLAPPPVTRTLVAEQGDEGIVGQRPPQRRKTLLAALGGDRIAALAKAAGDRAKKARAAAAERDRVIAAKVERIASIPSDIAEIVVKLRGKLAEAEAAVVAARAEVDAERVAREAADRRDAVARTLAKAEAELGSIEKKITEHAAILGRAAAIHDAADRLETARQALTRAGEEAAKADRDVAAALTEGRRQRAEATTARDRERHALLVLEDADALLREADAIEAAAREADRLADVIGTDRDVIADLESRLGALRTADRSTASTRIDALRRGHEDVIAAPDDAADVARAALAADDVAACGAGADAIVSLERQLEAHRAALGALVAQYDTAARKAARAELLRRAEKDRATYGATVTTEHESAEKHLVLASAADAAAATAGEVRDAARARVAKLEAEIDRLRPLANQIEALRRAEGAAETLGTHRASAAERVATAQRDLDALPPPAPRSVGLPASARLEGLQWAERSIAGDLRVAEEALGTHRAVLAELEPLRADRSAAQIAEAWDVVASALGPRAMQSLAIELACPELTETANDLLHACLGPRWTMRFETSRPTDDGGEIDECLILVTDAETGIERDARKFSKGQKSTLGVAANLSLAALVCGRAGVEGPTIVIDEGADDVSEGNVEAYVAMVRRAAEQIGAKKVLIVTHRDDLADLADVRVAVAGGKVEVVE